MNKQTGNYDVDLTVGCHTIFVYCDFVRNEVLGDTQTDLFRAVPLVDNKSHRTFVRIQWLRVIESSCQSMSGERTNFTLQFKEIS